MFMIVKCSFFIFILVVFLQLHADTPLISFDQLQEYSNQLIRIKGFLYEDDTGKKILSDTPNLKTCCIGKKGSHLIVEGDFEIIGNSSVIEIEGEVILGQEVVLKNARVMAASSHFLGIILLIALVIFFLSRTFKKNMRIKTKFIHNSQQTLLEFFRKSFNC